MRVPMRVPFKTGAKGDPVGYPLEARHCECGVRRQFDGVNCWRCGFHTLAQIRGTWALAAQGALTGYGEPIAPTDDRLLVTAT